MFRKKIEGTFKNLTPHTISVGGLELEPDQDYLVPRVRMAQVVDSIVEIEGDGKDGIEVEIMKTEYGEVENLPEPEMGVFFIVSTLVLVALKARGESREGLVAPDTGPSAIRDETGRIQAITRFQVV